MFRLFIATILAIGVTNAAASTQTGKITKILVRSDGLHYFYLSGPRGEKPHCATNHAYWMIKDESTTYGKSQFSMLLAAYMTNKTVKIFGSAECTRWGDGEDIKTVLLEE